MPLYSYTKIQPRRRKVLVTALSATCIMIGITLLVWIFYPIAVFEIYYAPKFGTLMTPVSEEIVKNTITGEFSRILGSSTADYTRASVWFPKASSIKISDNARDYSLSIPKLKIENANVKLDGDDLSRSLIQFTGPLPGNPGNAVIFGHSTIPWLYNPRDYKTIFSKLPDLTFGDNILITSDRVTYRYKVINMKITVPSDLSVLDQNFDNAYMTLITCVPQGTYLKRLIVKTVLEKI